jgi:hypothetical protein
MFQLGLFTTHLPYVLIIAFYAAAILFKPSHEEATLLDDKTTREHSCLVSCTKDPYLNEISHQFHVRKNYCYWKAQHGIRNRQTSSPPIIPTKLNFLTSYLDEPAHTFLSRNIPNRAPPAGDLLNVVSYNFQA